MQVEVHVPTIAILLQQLTSILLQLQQLRDKVTAFFSQSVDSIRSFPVVHLDENIRRVPKWIRLETDGTAGRREERAIDQILTEIFFFFSSFGCPSEQNPCRCKTYLFLVRCLCDFRWYFLDSIPHCFIFLPPRINSLPSLDISPALVRKRSLPL